MLKKSKLTIAGVLALSLFVSACATQRFNLRGNPTKPKVEMDSQFFVAGLAQSDTIDAAKICGGSSKITGVEVEYTFVNGVLNLLSGGVYSPRKYRVYCRR